MAARPLFAAFTLALFAAPLAAKPGAPPDATRIGYRSDSIAACTRQLGDAQGADATEVEALCSCAADRFIARGDASALPALDGRGMPAAMRPEVLGCLGEVRPAAAGALAAEAMRPPVVPDPNAPREAPVLTVDKPVPGEDADTADGPTLRQRGDMLFGWLSRSGIPRWAWGLIALVGFFGLRRLFRRQERDDNLMGPPRPERFRNLPRY
jgi:hypothetical protein